MLTAIGNQSMPACETILESILDSFFFRKRRRRRAFVLSQNFTIYHDLKFDRIARAGAASASGEDRVRFNSERRGSGRAPRATFDGALGSPSHCLDALFCDLRLRPSSARAGRRSENAQWAKRDGRRAALGSARRGRGRGRVRWRARVQACRLWRSQRRSPHGCDTAPMRRRC